VIDVEPLIREELERAVALPEPELADWGEVLRRSGEQARRRRRRIAALAVTAAAVGALVASPLGGAIARGLGGFSSWLSGAPGTPAGGEEQRSFEQRDERSWASFPETPQLRELIRMRVGDGRYTLYGFHAGNAFCLRLTVKGIRGAGPMLACTARSELATSRDLVIPLKGDVGLGHVGPLPRTSLDPPSSPRAIVTFGFAAQEAARVRFASTRGDTTEATVGGGAFLHVLDGPKRGQRVVGGTVEDRAGAAHAVRLAIMRSGFEQRGSGLPPKGPSRVERKVAGGQIAWFAHRSERGEPLSPEHRKQLAQPGRITGDFARVIQPDPDDFLRMLVANNDRREICTSLITRGGIGGGCTRLSRLFAGGPLALSSGFSGAGQQYWLVSGLVSDEVARVVVFLSTGERRRAPLRDNVVIVRVSAAKFPARVVGYDAAGRVIGVLTIGGGRPGPRPIGPWRVLIRLKGDATHRKTVLRVARSSGGGSCMLVSFRNGESSGCFPPRWRGPAVQVGTNFVPSGGVLYGRVRGDVRLLEVQLRDAPIVRGRPRQGFVLVTLPSFDVVKAVGLDAQGRELGEQSFRRR
jgi:hypothetical protein